MILEKITCEKCVTLYNVEIRFLEKLNDSGLIAFHIENNEKYIHYKDLHNLEKFMRWHYDMDINFEGIEVIHRLIKKMELLQQENMQLLEKVKFHQLNDIKINDI